MSRLVLIKVFIKLQHMVSSHIAEGKKKSLLCQCYLSEFVFTRKLRMLGLSVLEANSISSKYVVVKFTI